MGLQQHLQLRKGWNVRCNACNASSHASITMEGLPHSESGVARRLKDAVIIDGELT